MPPPFNLVPTVSLVRIIKSLNCVSSCNTLHKHKQYEEIRIYLQYRDEPKTVNIINQS